LFLSSFYDDLSNKFYRTGLKSFSLDTLTNGRRCDCSVSLYITLYNDIYWWRSIISSKTL